MLEAEINVREYEYPVMCGSDWSCLENMKCNKTGLGHIAIWIELWIKPEVPEHVCTDREKANTSLSAPKKNTTCMCSVVIRERVRRMSHTQVARLHAVRKRLLAMVLLLRLSVAIVPMSHQMRVLLVRWGHRMRMCHVHSVRFVPRRIVIELHRRWHIKRHRGRLRDRTVMTGLRYIIVGRVVKVHIELGLGLSEVQRTVDRRRLEAERGA